MKKQGGGKLKQGGFCEFSYYCYTPGGDSGHGIISVDPYHVKCPRCGRVLKILVHPHSSQWKVLPRHLKDGSKNV